VIKRTIIRPPRPVDLASEFRDAWTGGKQDDRLARFALAAWPYSRAWPDPPPPIQSRWVLNLRMEAGDAVELGVGPTRHPEWSMIARHSEIERYWPGTCPGRTP